MNPKLMFIIANNDFLAKRLANNFSKDEAKLIYPESVALKPNKLDDLVTFWNDIDDYKIVKKDILSDSLLNIVVAPFRALMNSYDLYNDGLLKTDVIVVALKETDSTEAIRYEIYDIYADSSTYLTESVLSYYFNRDDHKFLDANFKIVKRDKA